MDASSRLGHLRDDSERLRAAAQEALGSDAPLPGVTHCPGWSVADLVEHVGICHRFTTDCLRSADGSLPPYSDGPPDGVDLFEWFGTGALTLLEALSETAPDTIRPSWRGDVPASWWLRRIGLETAVHRWDAQESIGRPEHLEADLAADGIAEYLELRGDSWVQRDGRGGTVHLHGTDGDGEFLITLGTPLTYRIGHEKGDVAVRGSLSDLYLMMWGRLPPVELDTFGETDLLDYFIAGFG